MAEPGKALIPFALCSAISEMAVNQVVKDSAQD